MMCLPEDEFPALPKLEKAKAFTLHQKALKDAKADKTPDPKLIEKIEEKLKGK